MSDGAALLGRVVAGKFKIEDLVGSGAMGEVFRARHVTLDTMIALKIMRADIAKDAMFKERFYREAKAASRLDHPNSVRVLDFGVEPDGLVYIAMEFLHGRDLLSVLRDEWPIPDERIVDLLVQTLAAVSVAHDLGIVHRDLKPENIMVSVGHEDDGARPYHVKVCDFGIAKLNDPRGFQTDGGKPLTSSGTLIGTPEYMSPEQARGDALDARSDVYAVGIILYQLLVGRVPFSAENALGVVLKQVTDEPVPPSKVRPGVNPRLEAICLRALKKSRDERYQSAKEMRRDLRGVFGYRPMSIPDESGAHLPAVAPRPAGLDLDVSSAPTVVQTAEAAAMSADFAPKETSDGTELTVPLVGGHRHLGAILAVAILALLVGAGAVLYMAKRGPSDAERAAASASASASAALAANAPLDPSGEPASDPVTTPPLDPAGAGTAKGKHPGAVATKASPPAGGASAAHGIASAAPSSARSIAGTGVVAAAGASASGASKSAAPALDPSYNPAAAYVALGALTIVVTFPLSSIDMWICADPPTGAPTIISAER